MTKWRINLKDWITPIDNPYGEEITPVIEHT